jgi:hypothetical protein
VRIKEELAWVQQLDGYVAVFDRLLAQARRDHATSAPASSAG